MTHEATNPRKHLAVVGLVEEATEAGMVSLEGKRVRLADTLHPIIYWKRKLNAIQRLYGHRIYIHIHSRVWINRVRLPILLVVN